VKVEDHDDARHTFERLRANLLYARDGVERLLDLFADVTLHRLGTGARPDRRDGDDRQIDVGKLVDGKAPKRKAAEHNEGQHDHRDEHGPLDGNV
jgi:hypothetical protein